MPGNILILGTDSIGRFLASQFANSRKSYLEVFMLFANESLMKNYSANDSTVRYENHLSRHNPLKASYSLPGCYFPHGSNKQIQISYSKALRQTDRKYSSLDNKHIDNLIVTDRRYQTERVLKTYREYMSGRTNVMFLNPVIGGIERAVNALYGSNNLSDRPTLWMAMSTHLLRNNFGFSVKHLGSGDIRVCKCPPMGSFNKFFKNQEEQFPDIDELPQSLRYFMKLPMLQSLYCPYKYVYMAQVEKMIVDCCLYPLTRFLNDDLEEFIRAKSVKKMVKDIIAECVLVLSHLQRVQALASVDPTMITVLRPDRLYELVMSTLKLMQVSSSKYRKHNNNDVYDTLRGEIPLNEVLPVNLDIYYSNDLIVELGQKKDIPTPVNQTLFDLMHIQMNYDNYNIIH